MCDHFTSVLRFKINQERCDQLMEVGDFCLNFVLKLLRYLLSLTNTYPVVEEKKMTDHFYINRESWTDKR